MKYIVVVPDGVSDVPMAELGNRTPLEVAKHPNMDWIAQHGVTGWVKTIPDGFAPGSDVGNMSLFGYDPAKHHTGRAPLEAAAQDIPLGEGEFAFRCNTLTVQDGVMIDHSADHITTDESHAIMKTVIERLGNDGIRYHAGVSYRHIAVVAGNEFTSTTCTPPHDIIGKAIVDYLPTGPGSELLRRHMERSVELLASHPINQARLAKSKRAATMLWFWGQGKATTLPPFKHVYGLRAACISAVDIIRGLGRLAGFDIIPVPGITGYFDTNYKGKAEYALKALDDYDLVLVHIEPTDEAGHMGNAKLKIQAIEDTDRLVVGTLLEGLKRRNEPYAILIAPDHPTSTLLKTHIPEPVPFAYHVSDHPISEHGSPAYTESAVRGSSRRFERGFELMRAFLKGER